MHLIGERVGIGERACNWRVCVQLASWRASMQLASVYAIARVYFGERVQLASVYAIASEHAIGKRVWASEHTCIGERAFNWRARRHWQARMQ